MSAYHADIEKLGTQLGPFFQMRVPFVEET